jgi:hypothetical protein
LERRNGQNGPAVQPTRSCTSKVLQSPITAAAHESHVGIFISLSCLGTLFGGEVLTCMATVALLICPYIFRFRTRFRPAGCRSCLFLRTLFLISNMRKQFSRLLATAWLLCSIFPACNAATSNTDPTLIWTNPDGRLADYDTKLVYRIGDVIRLTWNAWPYENVINSTKVNVDLWLTADQTTFTSRLTSKSMHESYRQASTDSIH